MTGLFGLGHVGSVSAAGNGREAGIACSRGTGHDASERGASAVPEVLNCFQGPGEGYNQESLIVRRRPT